MHLLKTAVLCAMAILLASDSMAQNTEVLPDSAVIESRGPAPMYQDQAMYQGQMGGGGYGQGTVQYDRNGVPVSTINMAAAQAQPPIYRVSLDAMVLKLDRATQRELVLNTFTNQVYSTTGNLDPGMEVGPRLVVDYLTETKQVLQVAYFGVYNWEAYQDIVGGDNLKLPGTAGLVYNSFDSADEMHMSYSSRINSGELNLLTAEEDSAFEWLFGLRFVKIDESFSLLAVDNPLNNGRYDVETRNDLLGAQVGSRWRQHFRRCWDLESNFKVGIFGNSAKQSTLMTNVQYTNLIRNFSPERSGLSGMIDYNFSAVYRFSGNAAVRVGYNLIWVDGIARATDQLDFDTTPGVSGNNVFFRHGSFMHGAHVGLEASW